MNREQDRRFIEIMVRAVDAHLRSELRDLEQVQAMVGQLETEQQQVCKLSMFQMLTELSLFGLVLSSNSTVSDGATVDPRTDRGGLARTEENCEDSEIETAPQACRLARLGRGQIYVQGRCG